VKFKTQEIVRGATRFAGDIDGNKFESGTVFLDVSLDSDGKGWGFRTEPFRCVDLAVVDRIKNLPFPFKAELDIEQRATKGRTMLVVIDVRPLERAVPGKA